MNTQGRYKPPQSFWEEVDRLEASIRCSSPRNPKYRKLGLLGIVRRNTAWPSEDDPDRFIYWNNTWSRLNRFGVSVLVLTEIVRVDPISEGISADTSDITVGLFGKFHKYLSGKASPIRPMRLDYVHLPDVYNLPEDLGSDRQGRRLDRQSGITIPSQEDYELLLAELRRGASGELQMFPPTQE